MHLHLFINKYIPDHYSVNYFPYNIEKLTFFAIFLHFHMVLSRMNIFSSKKKVMDWMEKEFNCIVLVTYWIQEQCQWPFSAQGKHLLLSNNFSGQHLEGRVWLGRVGCDPVDSRVDMFDIKSGILASTEEERLIFLPNSTSPAHQKCRPTQSCNWRTTSWLMQNTNLLNPITICMDLLLYNNAYIIHTVIVNLYDPGIGWFRFVILQQEA